MKILIEQAVMMALTVTVLVAALAGMSLLTTLIIG